MHFLFQVLESQEKEFFSGKWLQKLLGSSDVLVKIVEHMGSSLKEVEIHNIYNVFQLFTKPQVLQNLADRYYIKVFVVNSFGLALIL